MRPSWNEWLELSKRKMWKHLWWALRECMFKICSSRMFLEGMGVVLHLTVAQTDDCFPFLFGAGNRTQRPCTHWAPFLPGSSTPNTKGHLPAFVSLGLSYFIWHGWWLSPPRNPHLLSVMPPSLGFFRILSLSSWASSLGFLLLFLFPEDLIYLLVLNTPLYSLSLANCLHWTSGLYSQLFTSPTYQMPLHASSILF